MCSEAKLGSGKLVCFHVTAEGAVKRRGGLQFDFNISCLRMHARYVECFSFLSLFVILRLNVSLHMHTSSHR